MAFLEELWARIGLGGIVVALFGIYLIRLGLNVLRDPLAGVPGPSIARFTNLWLMREHVRGGFHKTNVELHETYGPIVRIAPGCYSIDSPAAAKVIYGYGSGSDFVKSSWYIPWGAGDSNPKNLFNELDPHKHSVLRRKVASTYSMTSMVSYEPFVDDCTTSLIQRLFELSASGVVFDLHHWLQCYAFETIGMVTFSKRLGFLEKGEDVRGIIAQLSFGQIYATVVGFFGTWHYFLLGCLTKMSSEVKGTAYIDQYSLNLIDEFQQEKLPDPQGPTDFLTKFLRIQKENPGKMSRRDILVSIGANIGAGSDTTGITLSAILYHLLKNPLVLQKLREELDAAARQGKVSNPITFQEAQELPYFQAVVKEGLRIHPATGFTMPRIVPEGGKEILGRHFPAGTTVGINSWVAHANRDVFGSDAKIFRPERWLENKELSSQREAYFFTFGQGSRTCIGKNISLLEISKAIPQIVRNFDFELQEKGDWNVATHWFTKPTDFICRARPRASS